MNSRADVIRDITSTRTHGVRKFRLELIVSKVVRELRRSRIQRSVVSSRADLRAFAGGTEDDLRILREDFESLLRRELGPQEAERVAVCWKTDPVTHQPTKLVVSLRDDTSHHYPANH